MKLFHLCSLECLLKWAICENLLLHNSHKKAFSPVCTTECCFNSCLV